MKEFIKSMLQDESGTQSTKRIIAFIGTIFLCSSLYLKTHPSPEVVNSITLIVCSCIGATCVDKLGFFFSKKSENPPSQ
jgi:hypothetical protein